jgi:hypothetical protein
MIGSFLMLFVPENCTSYAEVCSPRENLGTESAFGEFVLFLNCATAACFFIGDYYFNRRETWMIENLDTDDDFPPTNLKHVIDRYPDVKEGLRTHNARCAMLSSTLTGMLVANFIVSAAFVLRRAGKVEKICCPGLMVGGALLHARSGPTTAC